MSFPDLVFAAWWCGAGSMLGAATCIAVRRGETIDYEVVLRVLLLGIAAGLSLYLIPDGLSTIRSSSEFELRLLVALAIAWAAAFFLTRPQTTEGRPALALAAFIGVNTPPLALALSVTMVCGGSASCL